MLRLLNKVIFKDQIVRFKCQFIILISITVSFILLTSAVNLTSTIYTYDSKINTTKLSINLLEPNPQSISIDFRDLELDENRLIAIKTSAEALDITSLKVDIDKKKLTVLITNSDYSESLQLKDKKYENLRIEYSSNNNKLKVLDNSSQLIVFTIPKTISPIVTGVYVDSNYNNSDVKVEILTKPHSREIGNTKKIIGLIIFLVFIFLTQRVKLDIYKIRIQITKYDLIVVLFLIFTGFLTPPGIDDGEIFSILRNFPNMGFASTYSNAYPLGQWWFLLNSNWANYTDQLFLLRLPNLICYLLTWCIVDRFIIVKISKEKKLTIVRNLNTVIFSIFIVAWAGTLRYDPIALPLLSIIFASALWFNSSKNLNYLLILTTAWALSITSSLSGWIAAFSIIIVVLQNIEILRRNPFKSLAIFSYTTSLVFYLLFFNSNLWLLRSDIKSFTASGETHRLFMFNELSRYESISRFWGSAANWSLYVFLIVFFIAIFSFITFRRQVSAEKFKFLLLVLISAGGLVLTTSKYGWHFQANLPITVILSTYIVNYFSRKQYSIPLLILGTIAAWQSLKVSNVFNYTEFTTIRVNGPLDYFSINLPQIYGTNNSLLLISLLAFAILLFLYKLKHGKYLFFIIFTANLLVILPTIAYPVLDGKNASGWHHTKQNFYGIVNQDWRCGISGVSNVIDIDKKVDIGPIDGLEYVEGEYKNSDFAYYRFKSDETDAIQINFPEMSQENVAIWFSGVTTPQDGRVVLKYLDKGQEVKSTSLELNDNISKNDWQLVNVDTIGRDQISIDLELTNTENFRMTAPSYVSTKKLSSSELSKGSISTYRANLINFPCEVGDDKKNGVKNQQIYQFGLATNMGRDAIFNNELDLVPVGCLEMNNTQAVASNCFYRTLIKGRNDWHRREIQTKSKGY
jgi:hypothetical protein